jgi:CBS domain-containing protein
VAGPWPRMQARDIMTRPVTVAKPTDTLEQAARLLVDEDIGCLPVVDDRGALVGILTESDFQAGHGYAPFSLFEMPRLFGRYIEADGLDRIYADARQTPVAKAMKPHPAVLSEDASVEQVARAMLDHACHHVPIVRDGRLVGIVARRDLVRILAGRARHE